MPKGKARGARSRKVPEWRRLEDLTGDMERALRDRGAQVTVDVRIRDRHTGRARQVDVTVRIGNELTVVECRDRRGRSDVRWVEEAFGKRESLGAAHVILVSKAPFTRAAQLKAKHWGIDLRRLHRVEVPELLTWFRCKDVLVGVHVFQVHEVQVHSTEPIESLAGSHDIADEARVFRLRPGDDACSLTEMLEVSAQVRGIFPGPLGWPAELPEGEFEGHPPIHCRYTLEFGPGATIEVAGQRVPVSQCLVEFTARTVVRPTPWTEAQVYRGTPEILAGVATARADMGSASIALRVFDVVGGEQAVQIEVLKKLGP